MASADAACSVMRSRRNSTGSASVIGSTTTNPAGTSTAHRRERPCSARASTTATGRPIDERDETEHDASVGEQQRSRDHAGDDERAREREGSEEQRRRNAQRHALLVAVRERVHGCDRDVVTRREDGGDRGRDQGRDRRRRRRFAADRRDHREHEERGRDRAQRGERDGSRCDRREQPAAHASQSSTSATTRGRVRPVAQCSGSGGTGGERQRDPRDAQQPQRDRTSQGHSVSRCRAWKAASDARRGRPYSTSP